MKTQAFIFILLLAAFPSTMSAQKARTARLMFAGDISSASGWEQMTDKKRPVDVLFATLATNVEEATSSSASNCAIALSLSSRYVTKSGPVAMNKTVSELKKAGINYAGLQMHKDFTAFSHNDMKYGFASFGATPYSLMKKDSVIIKTIISRLKFKSNIVAVSYSYDTKGALGYEEADYMEEVKYFAHLCVDAGADVVYVSGFTTPLPMELYGDRLIIYGQAKTRIEVEVNDDGAFVDGLFLNGGDEIRELSHKYFPENALKLDRRGIMKSSSTQAQGVVRRMLTEAAKYRGRPYRSGATGPRAFDCSGYTSYIYRLMGYSLPRTSGEQYKVGKKVNRNELMPGDLVFFSRPATGKSVGHVGIVYSVDKENNNFTFIHASTSRGVIIDNFSSSGYFIKRYIGAKRVIPEDRPEIVPFSSDIEGAAKD